MLSCQIVSQYFIQIYVIHWQSADPSSVLHNHLLFVKLSPSKSSFQIESFQFYQAYLLRIWQFRHLAHFAFMKYIENLDLNRHPRRMSLIEISLLVLFVIQSGEDWIECISTPSPSHPNWTFCQLFLDSVFHVNQHTVLHDPHQAWEERRILYYSPNPASWITLLGHCCIQPTLHLISKDSYGGYLIQDQRSFYRRSRVSL